MTQEQKKQAWEKVETRMFNYIQKRNKYLYPNTKTSTITSKDNN